MSTPVVDFSFPRHWQAEILAARPAILPARRYIYPRQAEEVERGALEVLIRPDTAPGREHRPEQSPGAQQFLATCALGFRDPAAPTGIWSTPNPEEICAVSGGYAYLIDTTAPERFTMLPYRPVLEVLPAVVGRLLLFVGHRSILAWGATAQTWESEKLSDEGVTIIGIEGGIVRGTGWEMRTDRESAFAVNLQNGQRIPAIPG